MLRVRRIGLRDDLPGVVASINSARWDAANDMVPYRVEDLAAYLACADTVFLTCEDGEHFLGMGSGRIQLKPYDRERWFYLDELDVAVDQRQRGAGAALVKGFLELARAEGCIELWLGTELDNAAARALYRSLEPSDEEAFVGYNFRL